MNEYNTNITKLTCSCLDWKETRIQYPANDPRRLCKHIINKLDINNLPAEISKFKESIKFYQEKEWGFKKDFDEIIEVDTFTLLGDLDWIDVFDKNGNRYAILIEPFSKKIYWAKNQKPKKFSLIENFLIKESEKIPLPLEEEEYPQIISFIKDVLPHKKDFHISINPSQYIPTSNGIIYDIWESNLTPEQEKKLEQELLQKYNKDEAYYKLGEANLTPLGKNNEFCIYEALTVTNNEIIVGMDSGKKYNFTRNYEYIKQLKESRGLRERLKIEEQERLWQEELEQKRKTAIEKGYILAQDYQGNLYDIQNIYYHPEELSWDEYEKIKNSIFNNYDTAQHLIKEYSLNITTAKFNKALKNLNFAMKESSLNQNDWIIKGDGLNYGINLIKDSKHMHENTPDWYKVHIFDNKKMELINLDSNINIKMTSVLFKKNKFNELYQLVTEQVEHEQVNNKGKNSKQLERENWLRHVNCPNCGEKTNIHKKDKRKRTAGYTIQRFYCNECSSMFQMNLDELEKLIQEYQITKEKFIVSEEMMEVQPVVKKEMETVSTPKNEEKESNVFKKLFSFFKYS